MAVNDVVRPLQLRRRRRRAHARHRRRTRPARGRVPTGRPAISANVQRDREREARTERRDPRHDRAGRVPRSAVRRTAARGAARGRRRRRMQVRVGRAEFEQRLPYRSGSTTSGLRLRRAAGRRRVEQFDRPLAAGSRGARGSSIAMPRSRSSATSFQTAARVTPSRRREPLRPNAARRPPAGPAGARRCRSSRPQQPEPARAILVARAHPLQVRAVREDDERGHHERRTRAAARAGRAEREIDRQRGGAEHRAEADVAA